VRRSALAQQLETKGWKSDCDPPIRPEDEPMIVKFHEVLSETSVHFRYFGLVKLEKRVSHDRLVRICFNDYDREIAIVGIRNAPETKEDEIIAVGRLIKLRDANDAEFAMVISEARLHDALRRICGSHGGKDQTVNCDTFPIRTGTSKRLIQRCSKAEGRRAESLAVDTPAPICHGLSRGKIDMMTLQNKTLAIIMGGGAGTRLFPLTQKRAKPAVPLGGKYRLVDIPISNCLNGGFCQVYVLTQFNSEPSLRFLPPSKPPRAPAGTRARRTRRARTCATFCSALTNITLS